MSTAEALLFRSVVALTVLLVALAIIPAAYAQSAEHAGHHIESGQQPSGQHGDGHAGMHDIYKLWHPPSNPGTSCCNNSDCRPTRAFVDEEGNWKAWNGAYWLTVPQDRVLPSNLAGDGRSHLCEKEQFIYCFTPGEIRG